MGYIAHKDGERVQTVKEHLEGTAERAGNFIVAQLSRQKSKIFIMN